MTFTFATYVSATGCDAYGPAGPQALATYLEDRFSYQTPLGICNCRPVRGGTAYSHHAECRAYDSGIAPLSATVADTEKGMAIINLLGLHGKRLGIDHMIYDRTIWSAKAPGGRYYTGVHPHYDHIHIGLTRASAANLTYATLVTVLGDPQPPKEAEIVLPIVKGDSGEDVRALKELLNIAYNAGLSLGSDVYDDPTVVVVAAHLGQYTGNADWKAGNGVGGRQYARLLKDLAKSQDTTGSGGLTEAQVKAIINGSSVVAP